MVIMFPFLSAISYKIYENILSEYDPISILISKNNLSDIEKNYKNIYLRRLTYTEKYKNSNEIYNCCNFFNNKKSQLIIEELKKQKFPNYVYSLNQIDNLQKETLCYCPRCKTEYIKYNEICPECEYILKKSK